LIFDDSSSAGAAAITNNAAMSFAAAASAGSATINNNFQIFFGEATTAGKATITNNPAGLIHFDNTSTAGNASLDNFGETSFFNDSTAGSAKITSHGLVTFQDASTGGSATIDNFGAARFFDSSTAGSATIVNNGTLSFDNTSTAGNATITTSNGGNTKFLTNADGGNARLIANAGGVVDFSGTSGTLGDRRVSAGSIEGAGTFNLGRSKLTVGSNNISTEVSGVIADGGASGGNSASLNKVGTGTLTLSGQNTLTGFVDVAGGALIVNGSMPSLFGIDVDNGALLGGTGIISRTEVHDGGTFAPGGNAGPLTVQGPLSLSTAATYLVQIAPTWSGRANVSGEANIGGTVQAVFGPVSVVNQRYTILSATGGVTGTFASLTTNLAAGAVSLSYDANDVFLNVSSPFRGVTGLNQNQRNVANALNNVFNSTGSLPFAFFNLSPTGLTQVSGEAGTGSIQTAINAANQFLNVLMDPFIANRGPGMGQAGAASSYADGEGVARAGASREVSGAYAALQARVSNAADLYSNRWSVWGTSYGGSVTTDGNTTVGSHDTTSRVFGLVAGADYRLSPDLLAGFALAGGSTSFSLAGGLGHGSADLFQVGAFATQKFGAAYISGALAYGWQDVTTNRTVTVAGLDQLQARFKADTFSGRFEGGYRYVTSLAGITPYAAVQVTSFVLPNYGERATFGAGLAGLNYGGQTTTATRSELGARFDRSYALETAIMTLRGRTAWAHDFDNNRAITATFQSLPGASFVVNGARPSSDAALVSAGADLVWANGFSVAGTFEGEFSDTVRSYAGKGTLRYSW
jgi:autotransporter-associated beta strand protein